MPSLVYSYYDINGDAFPELLIGANDGYTDVISGIYALQNDIPISVIQAKERYFLNLLKDSDGKVVIEYTYGHMGNAEESFYTIDMDGKLVTIDTLYTQDTVRSKAVRGGKEEITEEEYTKLIRKYGSLGYESILDLEEARYVDPDWAPISN